MAWTIVTAFGADGALLSPQTEWVDGDGERFQAASRELMGRLCDRFDQIGRPFGSADDPPSRSEMVLTDGWAFPLPERPFRFRLCRGGVYVPELLSTQAGWAMTERTIETIESIEPGVHQYLPCELISADGQTSEQRWLLNVCTRADTIVPAYSNLVVNKLTKRYGVGPGEFKVAVAKPQVVGRAIWCEYRFGFTPLISDTLHREVVDRQLDGWAFEESISARHLDEIECCASVGEAA